MLAPATCTEIWWRAELIKVEIRTFVRHVASDGKTDSLGRASMLRRACEMIATRFAMC